jgi:hypothetical protein
VAQLLENGEVAGKGPPLPPAPETAWLYLAVTGAAFFLVGSANQLLAIFPLGIGNPEWEFGTAAAYFDAMPLPALGMALFTAAGVALGERWMVKASAIVMVPMSVLVLALLVLFALDVPIALGSVTEPAIFYGLQKAIWKGVIQGVAYPVLLLLFAFKAWRHAKIVIPAPADQ